MRIYLRFSCAGSAIDKTKTEIEVPHGSRISEVLTGFLNENNSLEIIGRIHEFVILLNNSPAKLGDALSEGDELDVLRILAGG